MPVINLVTARRSPDGLLAEYDLYTREQESPSEFHCWACLGCIASALGRNIYIDQGYHRIYPNLYIVLIAESAALHKSSCLNMARDIFVEAIPDRIIYAEKSSSVALISTHTELTTEKGEAVLLLHIPEFATFFGQSLKDPDILYILTDYYDCPKLRRYKTMIRGIEECKNICPTMLAGTTPEWVRSCLPDEAIGGGFWGRILAVYREVTEKPKNPRPKLTSEQYKAKENVICDLQIVSKLQGAMILEKDAEELYDDWYVNFHNIENAPTGMRAYYGRKQDTLLKVAMLVAVSKRDKLVITYDDLKFALALINSNEKHLEKVARALGQNDAGRKAGVVLEVIKKASLTGIPHRLLQQKVLHMLNKDELYIVCATLQNSGQIRIAQDDKVGRMYYYCPPKVELI